MRTGFLHPDASPPARIIGLFLLAGALWALASDNLLRVLGADTVTDARWSIANRVLFVLVTAALLAALLRQALAATRDAAASGQSEVESLALFGANPLPMWVYDLETLRFLAVNDAAVANYGWSREEFLAMTVDAIRPEEERPRLSEELALVGHAPLANFGQARHRRRNGTPVDMRIASHPIRFAGRRARLVLAQDISAQVRAQAALAASERRYRAIFGQAVAGVGELGVDGRWLDANDRLCNFLGYERDELLRLTFRDTTPAEDADALFAQMCRLRDREIEAYATEKRCVRKGGALAWSRLSMVPLREDGRTLAFIVVLDDITERKRIADELRILSLAVEQSAESIVITDLDGRVEYVNAAFTRASGYAREDLLGRNERILQSGRTPRATYEDLWRTLLRGETWRGEFINRRKDGTEYIEEAVISPVRQEDGRIIKYLGVKTDVTEQRRIGAELRRYQQQLEERVAARTRQLEEAREQAEAANRAKSAFLATMSHEIRTPMNGVLGMLEVLARSRLSEQQLDMMRTAQESARTLLGIIDDILDFSKIEAGRLEIERAPVSIADVVESLCDTMVPLANRRDVALSVFVAPEIPAFVSTDALRLRQILFNLIGNAIKFSAGRAERRGRVAVRVTLARQEPLQLAFAVVDNGIGMTPATIARLFVPFSQAEAWTTRRYGGTGLGLTICKRLAELMGGEIAVASQPGEGSTFTLTLPVEPAGGNAPAQRPTPDLSDVECLVVASDEFDGDGVRSYLEHAGARVRLFASTADAARAAAGSAAPVVVIHGAGGPAPPRAAEAFRTSMHVRHVWITRGRRRRPRLESAVAVTLDGTALRRHALLRAVAIAAGRALPEAVQDDDARAAAAVAGPPLSVAQARARGELILVAEDDEVSAAVLEKQLTLLGRTAEFARDGAEALQRWRQGGYALLLTDLHMPVMDGHELAAAIRAEEAASARPSRVPIVALTANALRGEAENARAAGMDDYLTKPLQLELLGRTLDRLMRPRAAADAAGAANDALLADKASSAFDIAVLEGYVGGDPSTVRAVLADFLRVACGQAAEIGAAAANDPMRAAAAAHRLKSAARAVGALALGERCAQVESAGRAGDADALVRALPALEAALAESRRAIEAALALADQKERRAR
jgi:PAS domain S-box-containing protein